MDTKSNHRRVGAFMLVGLITLGALVFIVGEERNMFSRKVVLRTAFSDVSGLRSGSTVRMGGVNVGYVTGVSFDPQSADRVVVTFEVDRDAARRIRRESSVASIGSKGLLGDKALDVTPGDPTKPQLTEGEFLRGQGGDEFGSAMRNAGAALDRANQVMGNIAAATQPLANDRLGNEILGLLHDLRAILEPIQRGEGTVGLLLRDPQTASRLSQTLVSLQSTLREIQGAAADVRGMTQAARGGHGLVHALLYDESGERAVRQLGSAADEASQILHDVRTGNGGLHEVVYGNRASVALDNLADASASVRDILHDVRQGRGTIGALLVDPSLYEDIKSLVGNVQRNEILRAMVRYSIRANERDAQGPVAAQPAPAPASATSTPGPSSARR